MVKRFKKHTEEHKGQLVPNVWLPGWDYQVQSNEITIRQQAEELIAARKEIRQLRSENYQIKMDCHNSKGFEKMAKFECNDMKVKNKALQK